MVVEQGIERASNPPASTRLLRPAHGCGAWKSPQKSQESELRVKNVETLSIELMHLHS